MKEYILGIPKNKTEVTLFTNAQDAGYNCLHFVGVFAEDLDKAKEKFKVLWERNFDPEEKGFAAEVQAPS